jgi:hypothetical protein
MLANGVEPAPGQCLGPNDRAEARRAAQATAPCGVSSVAFAPDSSTTATACGDCVPGQTFLEDGACGLGQYCTDDGFCRGVAQSTFWNATCAYDLGAHTSLGQCGPGLRCLTGRCIECIPGVDAVPNTMVCAPNGTYVLWKGPSFTSPPASNLRWTWSELGSSDFFGDPVAVSATLSAGILAITALRAMISALRGMVCRPPTSIIEDRAPEPPQRLAPTVSWAATPTELATPRFRSTPTEPFVPQDAFGFPSTPHPRFTAAEETGEDFVNVSEGPNRITQRRYRTRR